MRTLLFVLLLAVSTVTYASEIADTTEVNNCCSQKENPSYPGGKEALDALFQNNLKYPSKLIKKGITGTVEVHFFVEKDGSVTLEDYKFINMNMKIEREEAAFFVKEVRRVFKLMKKWTPGSINGEPVRVKLRQKVNFKLPY